MPIAWWCLPRVQTATIPLPGSRSSFFTVTFTPRTTLLEDAQMLIEHRVDADELLIVVGIHRRLRDQLIEFRITQRRTHDEHATGYQQQPAGGAAAAVIPRDGGGPSRIPSGARTGRSAANTDGQRFT